MKTRADSVVTPGLVKVALALGAVAVVTRIARVLPGALWDCMTEPLR